MVVRWSRTVQAQLQLLEQVVEVIQSVAEFDVDVQVALNAGVTMKLNEQTRPQAQLIDKVEQLVEVGRRRVQVYDNVF